MKKIIRILITLLLVSGIGIALTYGQMVNQNTQFTKIAMFTGKPIVKDTCFLIVNGTDTLRISIYGDTVRFYTNAGGGYKFTPELPGGGGNDSLPWLTGNGNLYPANTSLNVGIGTDTPQHPLHVIGDVLMQATPGYEDTLTRFTLTDSTAKINVRTRTGEGGLSLDISGNTILDAPNQLSLDGTVALDIETDSLVLKLADAGAGKVLQCYNSDGWAKWGAFPAAFNSDSVYQYAWSLLGNTGLNQSVNFIGTTDGVDLRFRTADTLRMTISGNGASIGCVGIGTTPSAGLRLNVTGGFASAHAISPYTSRIVNGCTACIGLGGDSATVLIGNSSDQYIRVMQANNDIHLKADSNWVNGKFRFTDGTESNGYALISDASGNATWQSISAALAILPEYADDAAAATGGVPVGGAYYNTTIHAYTKRES